MSSPLSPTHDLTRRAAPWLAGAMAAATLLAFAAGVWQQFFVGDDAYITFRYAENLAAGHGPVWNPGERVEGYTNFSWMLMLAVAIRLGLDPAAVATGVGVAAGLSVLAGVAFAAARDRGRLDPWVWVAPLALAVSRSFTAWSTGGLETMAFAALLWFAYDLWSRDRMAGVAPRPASAVLFAAAALTRPEGLLFAGVAGAFSTLDLARRRISPRGWFAWTAVLCIPVATHLLWRYGYYGQWLPNTFHAKVPGAWWEQGLRYLALFHTDYRIGWFLPLAVWGAFARRRDRGPVAVAMLLYLIYVAYVGGDRFEFRFLVPVLPFVLVAIVDGAIAAAALQVRGDRILAWPAAVAALGLILTSALGARSLEADQDRHGVASLQTIRRYAERRADEGRFLRRQIDAGRLPDDLVVCVGGAGALPYFTRWPTVDRRGINDATIARQPLDRRGVVAHERDATLEYLRRREVAVFDIFNRLVHDRDITRGRPPHIEFRGERIPVVMLPLEDRFMIFATPLSRNALAERLRGDRESRYGEAP